ncbi:hypothetical protein KAW65_05165 [candidate division WOR-3 bacterium]|nr:hypothetical protein [candidate division WOR-3 bacterium]
MHRRTLLLAFTFVGITSVITQTLFIRELEQIFYGNELCLGVIFAGWLFFSGIGSIVGRKIKKNIFPELQSSLSIILPIEFFLVHSVKSMLKVGPGELIPVIPMISICFTILIPLSFVLGLLFVQGCKWWTSEIKNPVSGVTRVYIVDALGDMTGGFIFAYLLIHLFSLTALFVVGLVNLFIALFVTVTPAHKKWLRLPVLVLAGLSLLGLNSSKQIEGFIIRRAYQGYEIINHKRSLYGSLVLVKRGSLYSVYQSGMLSFTYPTPLIAEEIAHFPFLEVKEPKKVLLLGGGPEPLKEILKYPIQKVEWVKLDQKVVDVCKEKIDLSILNDPRVKISWEDERGFVKRYKPASPSPSRFACRSGAGRFDLVIINLGNPYNSLLNRFYSLEFFEELKKILNKDGVVALSISSNLNYLSEEFKEYNGTIYKTLKKVFPQIAIVPGENLRLFGTQESNWLTEDPKVLSSRIRVPTRYVTKYYIPYEFYTPRINFIKGILDKFTPQSLNSDFKPISYYYNVALTASYFSGWFRKAFLGVSKIPFWITLIVILGIVLVLGFIVRPQALGIGALGASGIGAQLCLILGFEVLYGYMYHKIGIITGMFMLGLSIGAISVERKKIKLSSIVGGAILYILILGFAIKVGAYCNTPLPGLEFIFYILPIISGSLTGGAWAVANKSLIKQGESAERSSGLLNGIDLFGSCISSFFLAIIFIPIYGLYSSLLLLGSLNFIALLFLLKNKS